MSRNKCIKLKFYLNIIIPILTGGIFYYLFKPYVYFVLFIDRILGVNYHLLINSDSLMWCFCNNYLSDCLWAYSLVFSVFLVVIDSKYPTIVSTTVSLVFIFGVEIIQLLCPSWGTFDLWDILFECTAAIAAIIVIKKTFGGFIYEEIT